jgi:hypothetical protein
MVHNIFSVYNYFIAARYGTREKGRIISSALNITKNRSSYNFKIANLYLNVHTVA